ncbi:VanW family protein [Paenibacillus senegalimassiliensis]|uniref:VanW family protein n=1 Tax=Paenibacillus senegalimassiliensis TaxID=1737426 RepID=UPI00073F8684|nr:VanW family protein [Paenibacillus senegalimassiliensis]
MKRLFKFTLLVAMVMWLPTLINYGGQGLRVLAFEELSVQSSSQAIPSSTEALSLSEKVSLENDAMLQWAKQLDELVIQAGNVFSLDQWFKELPDNGQAKPADTDLEQIGSILLQTGLQAGLEVGERATHSVLPATAEPGYDLEFRQGEQDFTLRNPHNYEVSGKVEVHGGQASFQWMGYGPSLWKKKEITVEVEEFAQGDLKVEDHALVTKGRTIPGYPGRLIHVYAVSDGGKELLYQNYYAPQANLVYEPKRSSEATRIGESGGNP